MPFALHEFARGNTPTFRGVARDFEVYAHEECIERRGRPKLKGSGGMPSQKMPNFNPKENAVAYFSRSLLPHSSYRGLKTECLKVYAENLQEIHSRNFSSTHVRISSKDTSAVGSDSSSSCFETNVNKLLE